LVAWAILGLGITHDPLSVQPRDFLTLWRFRLGRHFIPALVVVGLFNRVVAFETI
jgi:hypothetical protein